VVVGDEGGLLLDCFCHKEVAKRNTGQSLPQTAKNGVYCAFGSIKVEIYLANNAT